MGKTSLILVALNESETPYIFIDTRGLPLNPGYRDIYNRIAYAISKFMEFNRKYANSLKKMLESIRGIEFMGLKISLSWKPSSRVDLVELFNKLDEWAKENTGRIVLVIDEAQRITGQMSRIIAEVLAYLYDHSEVTSIVVSGSEVGVLYRFLGIEDPEHPLYGRHLTRVELRKFSRETSIRFLEEGFKQYGISVPRDTIEYAVDMLDGVVGWLVEYGYTVVETSDTSKKLVERVLEKASRLVLRELEHLLSSRPEKSRRRYMLVLEAIARGYNTWSKIKNYLEQVEKKSIPKSVLHNMLHNLIDNSLIEKIVEGRNIYYRIIDPVLQYTFKKKVHI